MEWIAFFAAIAALALATDGEAKARKLARRVTRLEGLLLKQQGGA